jgi:hypothetical protein
MMEKLKQRLVEFRTAMVVALFVAPSLFFNVEPHVEEWVRSGILSSGPAGTTALQLASVVALAFLSIRIMEARWPGKIAFSLFGLCVMLLNFMNLLDATHAARGSGTDRTRALIAHAARINSSLEELKNTRAKMSPFTVTSEDQVETARRAVSSAERARDLECSSGVADRCRARSTAVSNVQSMLLALTSQRTMTAKAEKLDSEFSLKTQELTDLGPLPQHVDSTSETMGNLVGLPEETIIKLRPPYAALMTELFCLFGPSLVRRRKAPDVEASVEQKSSTPDVIMLGFETPIHKPPKLAALPPPMTIKKPYKKGASPEDLGSIRDWMDDLLVPRRGMEISAAESYESYQKWCKENGISPATNNRFGRTIKGELGIKSKQKNGRVQYQGLAFKSVQLRVVGNR